MQITKQEDGSYIIIPISQATQTMLDQIYFAYREWLQSTFSQLKGVPYTEKEEKLDNGDKNADNQNC